MATEALESSKGADNIIRFRGADQHLPKPHLRANNPLHALERQRRDEPGWRFRRDA